MFGRKKLREAQAQIEQYRETVRLQAELLATLQAWRTSHVAQLVRQAAVNDAVVAVTVALDRHPGDDLSDHPTLAAAVLLLQCANRSTLADDALLALAQALRDPMADMVDAIFG